MGVGDMQSSPVQFACCEQSLTVRNQWRRHGVDWGGHVHPHLLEVSPEIDTNPTSFYRAVGGGVAPPPDPCYRLALRTRHVCPPHIF